MNTTETVICTFRVRPDALARFETLIAGHWRTLRALELVTDTEEQMFLSIDDDHAAPVIVSIFEWVNSEAAERAHEHPDVASIWEAMEPCCEERRGLPAMEFPHYQPHLLTR